MLGEERWRQWEMFQWKLWDVWSWMDAMNLPLYVRILPPIYAPIVWLLYILYIYIMKVLFRMNRSVSSGVLSYLTPRFAWRFCCLDLLQAADVSNPTRPIRTARAWNSYVYEDNLFPSKMCLIERCGQRTERRQGWSVALYRIIPMFFPGKSQTICTKDSLLIFEGFPLSRTVFSLDICTFTQLDKIDPIKVNYSWIGEYTMVPYGSVIG